MNDISPKIVRVWFDTVLNPIVDGLLTESSFLSDNNLTWRSFLNDFEALKPLISFIHYRYNANFEQFIVYYPVFSEIIENHDNKLSILRNSCNELFYPLNESELLNKTYMECIDQLIGSDPSIEINQKNYYKDKNSLKYITEFIINNRGDLDQEYILHPIWNPYKDKLKGVLRNEKFIYLYQNLTNSINNFSNTVSYSINALKKLRMEMSVRYGVPIVVPRIHRQGY